jgi:peptide/nickel transport system ATP-binding protein
VLTPPSAAGDPKSALLHVCDLSVAFRDGNRTITAVDRVSFDVKRGEIVGLVGESGSGKTTIGRAILQLLPHGATGMAGTVEYRGENLAGLSKARMRAMRRHLQMIFQDPISSFNPRRKVCDIVGEGLQIQGVPKAEIARRVDIALADVGMSRQMVGARRPHQFSGGQCQRIAISRALALGPDLIVCDEPVASLDVSVQALVINLLQDLRERKNLALIFISHDLAVVRNVSDRVVVLYMGRVIEMGDCDLIYARPAHPYTRMLLDAVPGLDTGVKPVPSAARAEMPSQSRPSAGCRFRTRCPRAEPVCSDAEPELQVVAQGQQAACHFPYGETQSGLHR